MNREPSIADGHMASAFAAAARRRFIRRVLIALAIVASIALAVEGMRIDAQMASINGDVR